MALSRDPGRLRIDEQNFLGFSCVFRSGRSGQDECADLRDHQQEVTFILPRLAR